jgi:hypothetical protein
MAGVDEVCLSGRGLGGRLRKRDVPLQQTQVSGTHRPTAYEFLRLALSAPAHQLTLIDDLRILDLREAASRPTLQVSRA